MNESLDVYRSSKVRTRGGAGKISQCLMMLVFLQWTKVWLPACMSGDSQLSEVLSPENIKTSFVFLWINSNLKENISFYKDSIELIFVFPSQQVKVVL